jgi:hypothetical protein
MLDFLFLQQEQADINKRSLTKQQKFYAKNSREANNSSEPTTAGRPTTTRTPKTLETPYL